MPLVGFGTSNLVEAEVTLAIEAGARHLDCAAFYGNERMVGRAIRRSGVARCELFVTTKVWNDWHGRAVEAVDLSLAELGLDYIDLCLIHWPCSWAPEAPFVPEAIDAARDVWPQLARLVASGKVRSLGVSNFDQAQLEPLLALEPPCCVNQIEAHPMFQNAALASWCLERGVQVVAWGPLAKSPRRLKNSPELAEVALGRGVTEAAVALRWNLDRGVAVVPRSSKPANVRANLAVCAMAPLDDVETALVASCETGRRRFPDVVGVWPASAPLSSRILARVVAGVATLVFKILGFRLDLVALAKRSAERRERRRAAERAH